VKQIHTKVPSKAVIGASANPEKTGHIILKILLTGALKNKFIRLTPKVLRYWGCSVVETAKNMALDSLALTARE